MRGRLLSGLPHFCSLAALSDGALRGRELWDSELRGRHVADEVLVGFVLALGLDLVERALEVPPLLTLYKSRTHVVLGEWVSHNQRKLVATFILRD